MPANQHMIWFYVCITHTQTSIDRRYIYIYICGWGNMRAPPTWLLCPSMSRYTTDLTRSTARRAIYARYLRSNQRCCHSKDDVIVEATRDSPSWGYTSLINRGCILYKIHTRLGVPTRRIGFGSIVPRQVFYSIIISPLAYIGLWES